MSSRPLELSVIVPVLDEDATIGHLLSDLSRLATPHEVIVVDGGSRDRTAEVARAGGARVVASRRGRGVQLRAGAMVARAPMLLFAHADARLDAAAVARLDEVLAARPRVAMAFRLRIAATGLSYRLIEWGTNVRSRLLSLPYGDQGLLVSHEDYARTGGHPPVPLMEDVILVRRLAKTAGVRQLDADIRVSARRWRADGPWRRMLGNWLLLIRFLVGTPPERLGRRYPPSAPPRRFQLDGGES